MPKIEITNAQFKKIEDIAKKNGISLQTLISQIIDKTKIDGKQVAPIAISTSVVKQIQAEKKYNFFNYITEQDKLNRVLGIEEQMSFDVTNAFFWHNLEDEFKAIGKALHSSIEEWENFIKENERNQNINFALKYVNYIDKEYEKVLIENRDENFAYAYFKNLKNPSLNIDVFANKFSKKYGMSSRDGVFPTQKVCLSI